MERLLGYNAAYTLKCTMEKLKKVICSHNFLLSHEKNYFHLFMTIFLTHSWGKQCVSKRKTWNHSQARDSKLFFFQHTVFPTPDPENQSFTGENVFLIEKTENYVNKVPFISLLTQLNLDLAYIDQLIERLSKYLCFK